VQRDRIVNKIEEVELLRLERNMAALKYAETDQSFLFFIQFFSFPRGRDIVGCMPQGTTDIMR